VVTGRREKVGVAGDCIGEAAGGAVARGLRHGRTDLSTRCTVGRPSAEEADQAGEQGLAA
jgi:hypothetical protein